MTSRSPEPPSAVPAAATLPTTSPYILARARAGQAVLPEVLQEEAERAASYAKAARSAATQRVYAADWRIFEAWCAARGLSALPTTPEIVAVFAGAEADAGLNPRTIGRRVAAIGYYHRQAGLPPPTAAATAGRLTEVLAGIRATHGKPKVRKRAADATALRALLATIEGDGLRAARDRAVLAIGMSAALRRSELVAVTLSDVLLVPQGLQLTIRQSKTDRAREGVTIAIPEGQRIRPKALLLAWMDQVTASGTKQDRSAEDLARLPLFRRLTRSDQLTNQPMSDRAVARLVQRCAAAAGYDPTLFAGHSLRSGFLTEAANNRASIFKMQEVSRHKSVQVLSEYVRNAELFHDHAGAGFL